MPVIVVTRLRLKDPVLLDKFFAVAVAVAATEQAQKSDGNLGVDALADANNAWWSVSSWAGRPPMQAFMDAEPHAGISKCLDHFCDEATFVDRGARPSGPTRLADQLAPPHRRRQGRPLTHPSDTNQTRAFPPPVEHARSGS
jgi:hypothetical protein